MIAQPFVSPDDIRATFCTALSSMYREEVPLYGDLVQLVNDVNEVVTKSAPDFWEIGDRLRVERHGAIRLGTKSELTMIARLFKVMGMFPVGYYDLSTSGVPVHSTAFRPTTVTALEKHPFRIFTSLLRPELIPDVKLRQEIESILVERDIFHPLVRKLVDKAEKEGGLNREDSNFLVESALETFKWHDRALVDEDTYTKMKKTHPLLADVAGFKGPHINHLTPRTLDIDAVQRMMAERGIPPKMVIEGPPRRLCPILLRQTSFQALTEPVLFAGASPGENSHGSHRARFGEIESRGAALTPQGHFLYQSLMKQAGAFTPTDNNDRWQSRLSTIFSPFPDTWNDIRKQNLAYFRYTLDNSASLSLVDEGSHIDQLLDQGIVKITPIVYEDFLPASAAGIFQSNLGDHQKTTTEGTSARVEMETALGTTIQEYFELYADIQHQSLLEIMEITGCQVD
ncbi:uncharacterized protein IL334_003743 [Kwoniella shivajii]|uniref:2-oxoadipate dioxygenase/decarboxylase n=1 Tax=Kwoniella shivajii TaxID=564305 RepID=A0ABZ1CYQ7_9TREE|nr:hypothetical protein IL334_003743 [Kwoniella shivajii]